MLAPYPRNPEVEQCPFCRVSLVVVIEADVGSFAVNCKHCGAIGPTGGDMTAAVRLWNTRASVRYELASLAGG